MNLISMSSLLILALTTAHVNAAPDLTLKISTTPDNNIELRWEALNNRQYQVEYSDDLQTWNPHGFPHFGHNASILLTTNSAASARFFRVEERQEFKIDVARLGYWTPGNTWTYQVRETMDGQVENYTETTTVKGTKYFNGTTARILEDKRNGSSNGETYIADTTLGGLQELGSRDSDGEEEYLNPYNVVFPETFTPENKTYGNSNSSELGPFSYEFTAYIETTPITNAAGIFPESIKTVTLINGNYQGLFYTFFTTEWYVLGIGMIKQSGTISTVPDIGLNGSIEMTLTAYSVQ